MVSRWLYITGERPWACVSPVGRGMLFFYLLLVVGFDYGKALRKVDRELKFFYFFSTKGGDLPEKKSVGRWRTTVAFVAKNCTETT